MYDMRHLVCFQVRDGGLQLLEKFLYEGHSLPRLRRHEFSLALSGSCRGNVTRKGRREKERG